MENVITKDQFEWGSTLSAELTAHIEIKIDEYIMEKYPQEYNKFAHFDISIQLTEANRDIFVFSVSFNKIPNLDIQSMNKALIIKLSKLWKYIFEGTNGYYIIKYNTLRIGDMTGPEDTNTSFLIRVQYRLFDNINLALIYFDEIKMLEERSERKLECDTKYKEYKNICDGFWNMKKDRNIDNFEALKLIESLQKCISLRREHLNTCQQYNIEGHEGAIRKMGGLRNFYVELIVQRLRNLR